MVNRKRTAVPVWIGALVVACLAGLFLAGCTAGQDVVDSVQKAATPTIPEQRTARATTGTPEPHLAAATFALG